MVWQVFLLLFSSIGLFLSTWILLPPPTFFWLQLAVGAPELSPWLVAVNLTLGLLALVSLSKSLLCKIALGLSLAGFFISILPLLQFPATQYQAAAAIQQALGTDYLIQIPKDLQQSWRSHPLVLTDVFRGIPQPSVRQDLDIEFARPDGESLTLNLYRPGLVGQYPAIVILYGGGWQNGQPANNVAFSRYMAAQGYSVVAIDYRHAPRYQFPAQLEDVKTALSVIRDRAKEWEIDIDRMALLGRSAGAQLAMLAAYATDIVPIRAVVNYYGPVDLTVGYNDPPQPDPIDTRALLRAFLGGTPTEQPERYQAASPISYVTRPVPPSLLVYGRRDHVVQAKFGQALFNRLNSTGNQAIFLDIPWAEHAFDAVFQGVSNQLALYYTERFLAWALYR